MLQLVSRRTLLLAGVLALAVAVILESSSKSVLTAADSKEAPFNIVVMDPLSDKLACDCVQGYAQRKYEKLAEYLEGKLKRKVQVFFSESLEKQFKGDAKGQVDLVIGKHSVVLHDAKVCKIEMTPVAGLTGKDGKTTQTGFIVVTGKDPAKKVEDLKGYRILFGPAECEEKSGAAVELLKKAGIDLPKKLETSTSCSDAATKIIELSSKEKAAAVISSYAGPLLEGCGTIKKGEIRVIGETKTVPFITAFVPAKMPADQRSTLVKALTSLKDDEKLLEALETKTGFVANDADKRSEEKKNPK